MSEVDITNDERLDKWGRDMAEGFAVKDSGVRQEYASGMVRDTQEGKADYTLLPLEFLERWAQHMTKGAVKYGRDNWRLAGRDPESAEEEWLRFRSSAFRHLTQWVRGDRDEDHAAAVCFNIAAAEYVLQRMQAERSQELEETLEHLRANLLARSGIESDEPPF